MAAPDIDLMATVVPGYAGVALGLGVRMPGLADPRGRLQRVHTRDWTARKSPVAEPEIGDFQQQ